MSAEERRFLDELGSDILYNRPRLVFIQSKACLACPSAFRITEYLEANGWTRRYLAEYRLQQTIAGFVIYRLETPGSGRGDPEGVPR